MLTVGRGGNRTAFTFSRFKNKTIKRRNKGDARSQFRRNLTVANKGQPIKLFSNGTQIKKKVK